MMGPDEQDVTAVKEEELNPLVASGCSCVSYVAWEGELDL